MNIIKMIKDFISWRRIINTSENYIEYLRAKGVRVGENCTIYDRGNIVVDLTRPWLIEIGNNVEITAKVVILTHGYDWSVIHNKTGEIIGSAGKVKIGNNVFIGIGTTILPGANIGDNVVIGAGSVVKGKIEENSVYAGVPAKKISSIDVYFEKRRKLQLEEAEILVKEYKEVYKTYPPIEVMHEYFWLFENQFENLHNEFKNKLALKGNFEKSFEKFKENKPLFTDYKEFLIYCESKK